MEAKNEMKWTGYRLVGQERKRVGWDGTGNERKRVGWDRKGRGWDGMGRQNVKGLWGMARCDLIMTMIDK